MAVTIHISGHLRSLTDGVVEIPLSESHTSVDGALLELWRRHPALRDRVLNEQGEIRQHVNIFADGQDVKRADGLATQLRKGEIHIFNAVSGG
jgi:molybdopterin synthase sulfur carrier subunit